jgi:serine/threonine-protein kinase
MMRPPSPLSPPDTTGELLQCLRAARLLSGRRAHAWARQWAAYPATCEERVHELVAAGALTSYQANQVLAGRARRLRLGPYRVLDRLGVGGMGHVYKAEHILMRRLVALKIVARLPRIEENDVLPRPTTEPSRRQLVARFRREVRSAARMSHPNVVTAYDAGVARGFLFLVMEYVEGIDLGRCVKEKGPLPVPLACEAIRQAALALQYAHDRGLVHRDIKPDNLLLTQASAGAPTSVGSLPSLADGTSGEGAAFLKLLDLGLALPRQLPAARAEPAGTPDFMAPEQANGREPVDDRSDLYSLGCTFYYLLTGRVPYPGGSCSEKLLRHELDSPRAVSELRPDVPPAVSAVVERLMAKKPEDRYPGPAAVASVLWSLAEQGWTLGSPPPARATESNTCANPVQRQHPTPNSASLAPTRPDESLLDAATDIPIDDTPSMPSLPQLPAMVVPYVPPRRRLPKFAALVAAVLVGPLLALVARGLPSSAQPEPVDEAPPPRSVLPFQLASNGRDFVTLSEALNEAADGDTVTIHGAGPHLLPATDLGQKVLTLRAAAGDRPRLEARGATEFAPWQALLSSSRSLTLQGLDLASSADAPVVAVSGGALRLNACRLTATGGGPAVVARGCDLYLTDCRVRASATAVAVEVDGAPCTVDLTGNTLHVGNPAGVAVAAWSPEVRRAADLNLSLQRNTVHAGRVAAFRALAGRLAIDANANDFTFREALISFNGYAGDATWRRSTSWHGRDNSCHGAGYWLSVDGRSVDVKDAPTWQRLWAEPAANGSRQQVSAQPANLR